MSSPKSTTAGITISVTAETHAGCRKHMEDYLAVKLYPNEELRTLPHLKEQAYIGVFDGHGGKEAAKCARERLWDIIQNQPKYRLSDIESVKESLEEAFLALHKEMEPLRATWKRNKTGDLSTAGTTASTVIFRQDHIFVANVGDSTAILAVANPDAGRPNQHPVKAVVLTKDHKPEDPDEIKNIENLGGSVMTSRNGVPRVVWRRQRKYNKEGHYDSIPFLSVSRSLGDFWSYNPRTNRFTVSPKPDVHVHPLNPKEQRFIVIASDGLWNVMSPDDVVRFIWDYEHNDQECLQPRDVVRAVITEALRRWARKRLPADNIAVLIAFLSESSEDSPVSSLLQASEPTTENEDASIALEASPGSEMKSDRDSEVSTATNTELSDTPPDASPCFTNTVLSRHCRLSNNLRRLRSPVSPNSPVGKHSREEESSEAIPTSKKLKLDCDSGCDMDESSDKNGLDTCSEECEETCEPNESSDKTELENDTCSEEYCELNNLVEVTEAMIDEDSGTFGDVTAGPESLSKPATTSGPPLLDRVKD